MNISRTIASELNVTDAQVLATIKLIDKDLTVPFMARYRKEITGGLDDSQLRILYERLSYLRELSERKQTILATIEKLEKLTPELKKTIDACESKTTLEDIYRPYKPKRRTKAQIAREAGLEPLAMNLFENPTLNPEQEAAKYINKEKSIPDTKAALEGAKQILMEQFSEDATIVGALREYLTGHAVLMANVIAGKEVAGKKFKDYFEYKELIKAIPSHRALAILRGRRESILQTKVEVDDIECEKRLALHFKIAEQGQAADKWLIDCVHWAWRIKIFTHLELDLMNTVRESAETVAIHVFSRNLHDLLMAAPAGMRVTLGLDPGLRTGTKAVVIDQTGKVLATETIYPHVPQQQWDASLSHWLHYAKYITLS